MAEHQVPRRQRPRQSRQRTTASPSTDVGRFVWMSDIHLDLFYGTDRASEHVAAADCEKPSALTAHPYGRVGCDTPRTLLDEVLRHARRTIAGPDFVVVTGDSCRHQNDAFDDPEAVLNTTLSTVTESIQDTYRGSSDGDDLTARPGIVLPTIGNNDVTPDYYLDVDSPNHLLRLILQAWYPWITDPEEEQTVLTGGYWARDLSDTVTVISLNTVIYATYHDPEQSGLDDPLGQFEWLVGLLDSIAQANTKLPDSAPRRRVILIGHIPPTVSSFDHRDTWHTKYVDRFLGTVVTYRDVIASQLFGHFHSDEFRVLPRTSKRDGQSIHDDSIEPIAMLMASSVTAVYGSNPSYKVVKYNRTTAAILDFDTYYIDLEDPDMDDVAANGPKWKQLESFTKAFNVPDLSGDSLYRIIPEIANFESVAETVVRRKHVLTKTQDHSQIECDADCRLSWACTFQSFSQAEYDVCVATDGSGHFTLKTISALTPKWVKTLFLSVGLGMFSIVSLLWIVDYRRKRRQRREYHAPEDPAASAEDGYDATNNVPSSHIAAAEGVQIRPEIS